MITRNTYGKLAWIDIQDPTQDEIRNLMSEYQLDPIVAEELLVPTQNPRIEEYDNYIYLVLHFPALRHTHGISRQQEVDFIIGKEFIITTRYDTIDPLHMFSKVFEVNSILDHSDIGNHAGFIFFYMIRKLYKSIVHELEEIESDLENVEEKIFTGQEREMVIELSHLGRHLLNIRQGLAPHRDILRTLTENAREFFGQQFTPQLRKIMAEYNHVHELAATQSEWLNELRDTNDSLVSTRQNEIIKTLTLIAFITFPTTLLSNLFSMNTNDTPIAGRPYDFWIILCGMMALMATIFAYFRYKKWL